MAKVEGGSLRLFRAFGIDVFLHWSWAIVALIELERRGDLYSSPAWNLAEYLSLFGIVLLHEFGHALACRSVGGRANRILLWPLGGVAYVEPPQRPGAILWSIAAGPLVNVLLIPLTIGASVLLAPYATPDMARLLHTIWLINIVLLVFNLLPIYPLDGGQILRSLLWFVLGPARSLMIASVIGLIGAAGVGALALWAGSVWFILLAAFGAWQSWMGFSAARAQMAPRRTEAQCPHCGTPPFSGAFWQCVCGQRFDLFAARGVCPRCQNSYDFTGCSSCRRSSPVAAWYGPMNAFPIAGPATAAATPGVPQQQPGTPSSPAGPFVP